MGPKKGPRTLSKRWRFAVSRNIVVNNCNSSSRNSTIEFTIVRSDDVNICNSSLLAENGRYQYTLLVVCGVMFICVGCQYGVNAYILPSAECDLNMGSEEKGLLNVAFLIGT